MIYGRDLDEVDLQFLHQVSKQHSFGFIAVVRPDITFKAYTLEEDPAHSVEGPLDVVECTSSIASPRRGLYATLLNGFWLVADRKKRPHLERGIDACVYKLRSHCASEAMSIGEAPTVRDQFDLPPIQECDAFSTAIQVLEKQASQSDQPLSDEFISILRRCSGKDPVIRECLKPIKGYTFGVAREASKVWFKCAGQLRVFRSSGTFSKVRLRTELMIPTLVNENSAEEYLDWMRATLAECEDLRHFVETDFDSLVSTDITGLLKTATGVLSMLTSDPWF